jgi:DNA-binding XRE family transcriptional regulator
METLKTYSLDQITDTYIGKRGSEKREAFEHQLELDLLAEAIKQARIDRNLTREQLGLLAGVNKTQVAQIENNITKARFDSIIKVFKTLNAKLNMDVEFLNQHVTLV